MLSKFKNWKKMAGYVFLFLPVYASIQYLLRDKNLAFFSEKNLSEIIGFSIFLAIISTFIRPNPGKNQVSEEWSITDFFRFFFTILIMALSFSFILLLILTGMFYIFLAKQPDFQVLLYIPFVQLILCFLLALFHFIIIRIRISKRKIH